MTDQIKIGAKALGALNMPNACPRCFWIRQRAKTLPFQIFAGIFSSIDSYTKKIVHASFDHYNHAPPWLPEFKNVLKYLKVPHWSRFMRTDRTTGVTVSGVMDDLFENINGTLVIPDYKTAKFTKTQDKLLPLYSAQLNIYAWIQASLSERAVEGLYLIYFEPITGPPNKADITWPIDKYTTGGFNMTFSAHTLKIKQEAGMVDKLLGKAKIIMEQAEPPTALSGCDDCIKLERLAEMVGWF